MDERPSPASSLQPEFTAAAVTTLDIQCGMGPVRIVGDDQIKSLTTEALIYIERKGNRASIQFNTWDLENPKLVLPDPKPTGSQTFTGNATFRVPPGARLVVFNEGGNLEITGMTQSTKVLNHGDDVQLHDLKGSVELTTLGKVGEVRAVSGPVRIRDAAGGMTVHEVTGDVIVRDEGGPLSVHTVTGNVTAANATNSLPNEFPGKPEIKNIEGDVTLVKIAAELSKIEGFTGQIRHE